MTISQNVLHNLKNIKNFRIFRKFFKILLFCDSISDSSDSFYDGGISDFLTEIFHMRIDSTIVEIVIISDNIFHKSISLYYMVAVIDKICENKEFCFRGLYDFFSIFEYIFAFIKSECPERENCRISIFRILFPETLENSSYTC